MDELLLNKELISDKVTAILRKQILLGELEKGFHLSESKISKMLSISRGPVREAIKVLENEGLVYTPNNGRTIVVSMTEKDLRDLYAVRLNLEATAIRTIVEQGFNQNLDLLNALIEKMKKENNPLNRIRLDVDFHFGLVSLSQNRTLIKLWSVIRDLVSTLVEITTMDYVSRLNDVDALHERIIEEIRNNRPDKAIQWLDNHFDKGLEAIISHMNTVAQKSDE